MQYEKMIQIKDGRDCLLRSAAETDGEVVYHFFNLTHGQTDYLLTYPDENSFDIEKERQFLSEKASSDNAVELCAFVDGVLAGNAGIDPVGSKCKIRHRAEFGIAVEKSFWGKGIGRALTNACIECARQAGYLQLELDAVAENTAALALYESVGFREYGRNPKGFRTRDGRWQALVMMRLELEE